MAVSKRNARVGQAGAGRRPAARGNATPGRKNATKRSHGGFGGIRAANQRPASCYEAGRAENAVCGRAKRSHGGSGVARDGRGEGNAAAPSRRTSDPSRSLRMTDRAAPAPHSPLTSAFCLLPSARPQIVWDRNPPSTRMSMPVTKLAALGLARKTAAPISSWDSPKRAIGVWPRICWARGVGEPSAL